MRCDSNAKARSQVLAIFCPHTSQAGIAIQKTCHFALARTSSSGNGYDTTSRERTPPAPSPPQGKSKPIRDSMNRSLAREYRGRKGT